MKEYLWLRDDHKETGLLPWNQDPYRLSLLVEAAWSICKEKIGHKSQETEGKAEGKPGRCHRLCGLGEHEAVQQILLVYPGREGEERGGYGNIKGTGSFHRGETSRDGKRLRISAHHNRISDSIWEEL